VLALPTMQMVLPESHWNRVLLPFVIFHGQHLYRRHRVSELSTQIDSSGPIQMTGDRPNACAPLTGAEPKEDDSGMQGRMASTPERLFCASDARYPAPLAATSLTEAILVSSESSMPSNASRGARMVPCDSASPGDRL
jgi:hypothetical protein